MKVDTLRFVAMIMICKPSVLCAMMFYSIYCVTC
jgi:hypothetical protein